VVQVSGGALARKSSVAPSIKIKSNFSGKLRVDTFLEQGQGPALFLLKYLFFEVFALAGLLFRTSLFVWS
jgi:hypothetical protein